ncbi:MAG: hypothetical protein O7H41_17700, partial [Planctomycetota bacterium]|nr:hypothetical protein [Planctomycetota bacterium]
MSAGYREIRRPGIRWLVLEGWEEKLPLLEWADGWESIRGAEIRKVSVKKTILAAPSAGEVFLIKVYHAPTFLRRLLTYRRRSPAFRDVELFRELDRRGVPLSLPVAAGERRAIGFQGASCLVVRPVGGAVAIDRLLLDREAQGTQRRLLLGAYGAFARQVHESGVLQEDFDPNNAICLSPDADPPEIELVDMERVSTSD